MVPNKPLGSRPLSFIVKRHLLLVVGFNTVEGKPPRRGRFTFSYTKAQGNPEDGALRMRLRGPEPAGDLGPMIVNHHDCINLHCKIRKGRNRAGYEYESARIL